MTPMVRRREFVWLLAAAAATRPRAAWAELAAPLIGFIGEAAPSATPRAVAAFRAGLAEIGYAEGRNVTIDWRAAVGEPNRLRTIASDLIGRHTGVIVTTTDRATAAAKAATAAIPIVFLSGSDPHASGLLGDRAPPANITGLSWHGPDAAPSRLGLIRQLAPNATGIAFIVDPGQADAAAQAKELQTAATTMGRKLLVLKAANAAAIEAAFVRLAEEQVGALIVGMSPIFAGQRDQLVALAARHAIPAIYAGRRFAVAGGLISYGRSIPDAYRRAGLYAGWILNGVTPSALPVLQANKFDLVINLKTAKALALQVPQNLRAAADEVIE
jgi:putative tryptophan/tyrosine transport system substrate-binding protein